MNPVPEITHAEVQRIDGGLILIRWETNPAGVPVHLYASDNPAAPAPELRPLATGLAEPVFHVESTPRSPRPYFALTFGDGRAVWVAERVLPLEGARNFRDLGGYKTRSGQRIKWGVLYRSEHLTHLSDADRVYLRDIGIQSTFDLRTRGERERNPSRWHAESQRTHWWKDSENAKGLGERLQQFRNENRLDDTDHLRGFLSLHYRNYLEVQSEKYRDILMRLTQVDTAPALIHCTAGKDRTGIIVALILHLLGVDEGTIFADYLLTNDCADALKDKARFRMLLQQFGIERISEQGIDALRCAHAEYLQAAFDGMRENYGSVESYLANRLGFDATMTRRLQLLYLE